MGLYDYFRKSGSSSFIVSLSGGADSSAVACLVALMVRLSCKEIGIKNVIRDFNLQDLKRPVDIIRKMLTCVYQATENSSETTRSAASILAKAINAQYMEFDVNALVNGYIDIVEGELGRQLTWRQDDSPCRIFRPVFGLRGSGCLQT